MSEDLPLTAAEKRAAQARARADVNAHPLFPAEPGERPVAIAWIQIRRYNENGPVDHQRVWPASELQGQDDIFSMFGGGVYELWGRAALPNGQPGAIVKKVRLSLDGPPKPFAPHAQAAALAGSASPAAAAPAADRMDLMIHMMREERREARDRDERREREQREERERQQAREEQRAQATTQLMVQGFQVAAGIVTAILTRPAPPPPPPGPDLMPLLAQLIPKPDAGDPLDRLGKVLDIAKKINPEKATESLPELMQGFGEAMSGIAQVEQMRIEAAKQGLTTQAVPLPGTAAAPVTGNGTVHAPPPVSQPAFEPRDDPAALSS